ncbi:MAG: hypothetical protein JST84_23075 [Acidobacteria bacterium]|nr:hypothetical protein [Acidobacteriota bacterium]
MYSRPRFLEELHAIREEMSRECDYDMDLFAQMIRNSQPPSQEAVHKRQTFHRPPMRKPKRKSDFPDEDES